MTEERIAQSIETIIQTYTENPSLEDLARQAGYSLAHFQKTFKEYVGISPKRMMQYMKMRHVRELLVDGHTTLDAAYDAGMSGNGRLHDLFLSCEGISPGDIQSRGKGLVIHYGFIPSVLGEMMLAKTPKGLCWLGFLMEGSRDVPTRRMKAYWPHASFVEDDKSIAPEGHIINQIWSGKHVRGRIRIDIYGTNFQIQVWKALLQIPMDGLKTYQQIGQQIRKPKAARAVGNAVGANPLSLLIPCHRVIRASGIIDNYGWGSPRKKLLLAIEKTLS